MSTPEQARATQLRNIEVRTGQTLSELTAAVAGCGKVKHGEVRAWLMDTHGLGFGDANGLAAATLATAPPPSKASEDGALGVIYSGKKAHLRAIHDAVITALERLGEFEIAPKKGYVALRRKKQFAMLGPKTAERAELGINLKTDIGSDRILAQKPGGMCQYTVALSRAEDVDADVAAALKAAFDAAG